MSICPSRAFSCIAVSVCLASLGRTAEIHVSAGGADDAAGTAQAPFCTIGRAVEMLQPGDTCWIHEGIYRETVTLPRSGAPDKPIRIAGVPGERVIISAREPLKADWQEKAAGIYVARIVPAPSQLFYDGQMAREAHFPDGAYGDLMDRPCLRAQGGTDYEKLVCSDLPAGDFNDGYVMIWRGGAWTNATVRIKDYRPGESLSFDPPFEPHSDKYHQGDAFKPKSGNRFLLVGALAALDNPGEWLVNPADGLTYFKPPAGKRPEDLQFEIKARDQVLVLRDCSHIIVEGIQLVGGVFDLTGSNDCLLRNIDSIYSNHFTRTAKKVPPHPTNQIQGNRNRIEKCRIAYTAGSGINVEGEDNAIVNCVIHDIGYTGTYLGAVQVKRTKRTLIDHCSIYRSGRDLILHHGAEEMRITYCDLHHAVMLNSDAGATYAWGTDGKGSVIAYNWVHDTVLEHSMGIYLDNFDKNFVVHHNVVWRCGSSGITLNCDALNHLVANNTIAQCPKAFGTFAYHAYTPDQTGTRIVNNLVLASFDPNNPGHVISGEKGAILEANGIGAIDADAVPTPGSKAIDAGVEIPGITDGFIGQAPDLGAYERGLPVWRAGADWDPNPTVRPDIAFTPQPPITERTMVQEGLRLWLDASAGETLELEEGTLVRWRDRRQNGITATGGPGLSPAEGMGRTVIRCSGERGLNVGTLRAETGGATVLLVAGSESTSTKPWQRLFVSWCGNGDNWVKPSFIIMRPNGAAPTPFEPRILLVQYPQGVVLDNITVACSGQENGQGFIGDVAEVLVFDRSLRFDELLAIQEYLTKKWSIKDR